MLRVLQQAEFEEQDHTECREFLAFWDCTECAFFACSVAESAPRQMRKDENREAKYLLSTCDTELACTARWKW